MGKAQELFDRAVVKYDDCVTLIRTLDEAFKAATEKDYDTKITLAQFDWILQAVLLNTALADGDFDRLERQFVDKITDYGDLLFYIKKKTDGQLDLEWDDIARMDTNTQSKLMELLPVLLAETCDSFVAPLALVDSAVDTMDFLKALTDNMVEIIYDLSAVDGTSEEREAAAAAEMTRELLVGRWKKMRQ